MRADNGYTGWDSGTPWCCQRIREETPWPTTGKTSIHHLPKFLKNFEMIHLFGGLVGVSWYGRAGGCTGRDARQHREHGKHSLHHLWWNTLEFRFLQHPSCSVSALTGLQRCGPCSIREQPANKGTKETEKFEEMDVHFHPHPSYHRHHYRCLCSQTMDTETWCTWCLTFSPLCLASEASVYKSINCIYIHVSSHQITSFHCHLSKWFILLTGSMNELTILQLPEAEHPSLNEYWILERK